MKYSETPESPNTEQSPPYNRLSTTSIDKGILPQYQKVVSVLTLSNLQHPDPQTTEYGTTDFIDINFSYTTTLLQVPLL
jgi:hypothetical protein